MARYIDADAFIEDIKTEIVNLAMDGMKGTPRSREELYQIIERIGEQPTAYDVEAVVKELEKMKEEPDGCFGVSCDECKYNECCITGEEQYKVALDRAVDIVRGKE